MDEIAWEKIYDKQHMMIPASSLFAVELENVGSTIPGDSGLGLWMKNKMQIVFKTKPFR